MSFNSKYFERKAGSLEEAILKTVKGEAFEPHMMYDPKTGKGYKADTMDDHLRMKKMGYGHEAPKNEEADLDEATIDMLDHDKNDSDFQDLTKKLKLKAKDIRGDDGTTVTGSSKDIEKMLQTMYGNDWKDMYKLKGQKFVDIEEKIDAVNKTAVKKKFDDRKDKDIDNDGDVDSSDEYLHKRRKAVSKAITKKEGNAFGMALKSAKDNGEKTFVVSGKTYSVKAESDLDEILPAIARVVAKPLIKKVAKSISSKSEAFEYGTPEATQNSLNMTPGQSTQEWDEQVGLMHKKHNTMREALAKVWGMEEGHNPFQKEEKAPKGYHKMPDGSIMKDSDMNKKENKTMTGKPMTKVDVDPDVKEKRQS